VRTPVFIVCSPHERVGKTLLARMIAEFFISGGADIECFDLGAEEPSLIDYLPGCTTLATVADTRGQMALFDRLIRDDAVPKVVDLGARLFDQFFTVMAQVGLGEEARRRQVQVVVLFVVSPGPAAARAYGTLQRWLPGVVLAPVYNEVFGRGVRRDEYPTVGGASLPLRIPVLAAGLHRIVSHPGFSFTEFRSGLLQDIAGCYQSELESWVKRVIVEFRELELRLLLATLRLSLQF
jgi:hypothetical protein